MDPQMNRRVCPACTEILPDSSFPTKGDEPCDCKPTQCLTCWATWIKLMLDIKGPSQIACIGPGCSRSLGYQDFRQLADNETFDRYERLLRSQALSRDAEFHWCLNPDCGSGQFCEGVDEKNLDRCGGFECHHCKGHNCLKHERIHDEKTCRSFEGTEESKQAKAVREQSEQRLEKTTRRCPGCGKRFERSGGCNHMTCECGQHFCYVCLAKYTPLTEALIFDGRRTPRGFRMPEQIVMARHRGRCRFKRHQAAIDPPHAHTLANAFVAGFIGEVGARLGAALGPFIPDPRNTEALQSRTMERITSMRRPAEEFPQLARELELVAQETLRMLWARAAATPDQRAGRLDPRAPVFEPGQHQPTRSVSQRLARIESMIAQLLRAMGRVERGVARIQTRPSF